jgi:hypothetical protein
VVILAELLGADRRDDREVVVLSRAGGELLLVGNDLGGNAMLELERLYCFHDALLRGRLTPSGCSE